MKKKIMKTFEKLRKAFWVLLLVWFLIAILLIPPVLLTLNSGGLQLNPNSEYESVFLGNLMYTLTSPLYSLSKIFGDIMLPKYFNFLKIYTIVFWLLAIYISSKEKKEDPYENKEYGSARWAKDGEEFKILSKKEGILLSQKHFLPVDKPGNINVMAIGGSGAGKSASFVIPNALGLLGSYVFTDPKGELYDKTAGFFKEKGYDIKVLNLVTPSASDGFNPLLNIKSEIDVDIITNTIIRGQDGASTGGDPYWDNMAEQLLKAMIYLLQERPVEERNLTSCATLVRLANNAQNFNVLSELIDVLPNDHLAKKAYKNVEIASDKAYSSILSTLQSKLGKFESPEIAGLTATNTIDFKEIGKKKTVLYVISSDTHSTYDFILTIFFSQMIQQLYDYADNNQGALDVPTYFFLDEFANIGQIPDFDKKISTSRSRKISFNVILQNLDQLEAMYPKTYETIMANCDTHLFLGSNSNKTAEYFSKSLGEITIEKENVSKNKGKGDESTSTSKNSLGRALMTPDELKRLPMSECIIILKGMYPILAKKFFYYKEPLGKLLQNSALNNREYRVERGTWREFDPTRKTPEQVMQNLDRLFTDEERSLLGEDVSKAKKNVMNLNLDSMIQEIEAEEKESIKEKNTNQNKNKKEKKENKNKEKSDFEIDNILPINTEEDTINTAEKDIEHKNVKNINIEKELEAKFDELFGLLETDKEK